MDFTESSYDTSLDSFIRVLFSNESHPPFSLRLELEPPEGENASVYVNNILRDILINGANMKYGKKLEELTDRQKENIRSYMLSLGWDIEHTVEVLSKTVTDFNEDGSSYQRDILFNHIGIKFKPADPALNKYNSHNGCV